MSAPGIDFGVDIPFVRHLGFTLHRFEGGAAELRYTALPDHLNNFGLTHGGATLTLMDVSMAAAARSARPGMLVVTVELKCSFMAAAEGPLVAHGLLLRGTRALAFAESKIYDAQGRLCAHATGTFKYVTPKASADAPASADGPA